LPPGDRSLPIAPLWYRQQQEAAAELVGRLWARLRRSYCRLPWHRALADLVLPPQTPFASKKTTRLIRLLLSVERTTM